MQFRLVGRGRSDPPTRPSASGAEAPASAPSSVPRPSSPSSRRVLSLAARSTSSSWPWESARRETTRARGRCEGRSKFCPRLVLCYVARVRRASFDSCEVGFHVAIRFFTRRYSLASARRSSAAARVGSPSSSCACAGASLGTAAAAHSSRPVLRARDLSGAGVPRARSLAPASSPPPRPRRGERVGAARLDRRSEGLLAVCRACALPNLAGVDGLPRRTRRAQSMTAMPRHGTRTCRAQPAVPAA